MLIYHALLIGLTVIGIPFCRKRGLSEGKIPVKIYLFLVFAAFFILAAIRKGTGYDYNLYATWYNQLIFDDYDRVSAWSREKGFAVPLKILTVITLEWQPMFAIISFVVAAGIVVYIYKNSTCAYMSVAAFISLGFYYNSLNFMRQFIAAVIVSFALGCIDLKQPVRFLVLTLFASCFHFSALLMLPFYFILKIRMNWAALSVYCVITALSLVFSIPATEFVTEYFYKGYDPVKSVHMTAGLPATYAIIFGILFAVFYAFKEELIKKRGLNSVLINSYFFGLYFEVLGIKHSVLSRFALLFLIAPVLALTPDAISVIVQKIKDKYGKYAFRNKILPALAVSAFCVYGITANAILLSNNYNGVVPYRTVCDNGGDGGLAENE
ncbi:MAG: EpsG family protein [Oscillospiraceae bacterium]|nr:EpsG family protein [Oscillospiraceae bacterium]